MDKKMTREELIALVKTIFRCEGSEEELQEMYELLDRNLIDPELSDYIYWTTPEMTPEEIVDKALAFKPIEMPGPGGWSDSRG